MKRIILLAMLIMAGMSFGDELNDGWRPFYYRGHETVGSVKWISNVFKGNQGAIRMEWSSGAMKFGAEKEVTTEFAGWVDWTIEAHIFSEGDYGYAGAAMTFTDENGKVVGTVSNLKPLVAKTGWKKVKWEFSSPKTAKRFFVQLLSLDKEPIRFANMKIASRQGIDRGDISFEVKALPAEKNSWCNNDKVKTLNFSDAPIPTIFYMKGAKEGRNELRFVIDIPEVLEVKDAYCPNGDFFEAFRPLETMTFQTNGMNYVRYVYGNAKFFTSRKFGSLNPARYFNDEGTGIALVIGPKAGGEGMSDTYPIYYRMKLGDKRGQEKTMHMTFRPLPKNLRQSKNFFVFSWNNVDRHFASDAAANAALTAYEAAGFCSFNRNPHGGLAFTRRNELISLIDKRSKPYHKSLHIGNVWHPHYVGLSDKAAKEFGVRKSVSSDVRYPCNDMCPEYFTKDEKLQAQLRSHVHKLLKDYEVKDNEWILFDMEPWHSSTYCHCEVCHQAFAKYAGLDHVPTAAETQSTAELRDKWALFRCSHNAKSVELLVKYIHEYNPTLLAVDYDYVMPYGDEKGMMARRRSVAKDTLVNEQWLDGHFCSYYHKIDKESFDAIRNDTRHLKKIYVPIGANDGSGGYLEPGEVLSPRQVRQFALAAFVHGCPGIAFYSGNTYDGEILLALMKAQDDIASWEGLPWGKVEGKRIPTCKSEKFAFASTVKPNGNEIFALFNYDSEEAITVSLVGNEYVLEPYDVKFIECDKVN